MNYIFKPIYLILLLNIAQGSNGQASESILSNFQEAEASFETLPKLDQRTYDDYCNLRANAWTRILEVDSYVIAGKAFVLLTPMLQNSRGLNWWYHVAPFVYVEESSSENAVIFDPALSERPIPLKDWGKEFDPRGCVIGRTWDDYNNQLWHGGCVIFLESRFAFLPEDIKKDSLSRWNCPNWEKTKKFLVDEGIAIPRLTPEYCRR